MLKFIRLVIYVRQDEGNCDSMLMKVYYFLLTTIGCSLQGNLLIAK